MKKIMLTLAAALAFGASADIVSVPVKDGINRIGIPARLVCVKAAGSTASGTVKVCEIIETVSSSTNYVSVTNIVPKDATYQVADAFVGQTRIYTGANTIAWSNTTAEVVIGDMTNTLKIARLYDGETLKYGPVTNKACSIRYADVIAEAPVTNVVQAAVVIFTRTPYTNEVYSGTMSGGKLDAAVTGKYLLGGKVSASGTAFTGGNVYLVLEK